MLKGIEEKILATTTDALDLAYRMQRATNEGFIISLSVPKKLNNSTIEIHSAKRPFPINKFPELHKAIGGKWNKENTLCKFVKLSQLKQSGRVRLIINIYMGQCLNPTSWDKVEIIKGSRGRVLTPEMCNGAEIILMKALDLQERPGNE